MENAIVRNTTDLERLEGIITRNLQSFYEVGRALMEIRDRGLYRDVLGYETFEVYCKERWDFARRTAYQYIEAVKTIDNVRHGAQSEVLPANERQIRPLVSLPADKQREAWQQAVDTAPDGKVTAAHVYKIVKGMTNTEPPPDYPSKPEEPSDAMYFAGIAISQLERIHPKDPNRLEALTKVERWIQNHKGGKR